MPPRNWKARKTADMGSEKVKVYGATWCGDCHMATRFLDQRGVAYEWIDIGSDKTALEYVLQVNNGKRTIPTIVFQDGSILVEPSALVLATKLRLAAKGE